MAIIVFTYTKRKFSTVWRTQANTSRRTVQPICMTRIKDKLAVYALDKGDDINKFFFTSGIKDVQVGGTAIGQPTATIFNTMMRLPFIEYEILKRK